jgi:hypothetical protein
LGENHCNSQEKASIQTLNFLVFSLVHPFVT